MENYMSNEHKYENLYLAGHFPARTLDKIKCLSFDGDLVIASYPKTGTTWVTELCYLIFSGGDFNAALSSPIEERVQYLEKRPPDGIDKIMQTPSPRIVKTHLPGRFFQDQIRSEKVKVVLMIRNPLDTLVSLYHFYRMCVSFGPFKGSWDEFFALVKEKHVLYGDYFDWYGDWLNLIEHQNVLIIRYEDMKVNLKQVIDDVTKFIGQESSAGDITRITNDVKDKMAEHLSFESMSDNKATNYEQNKAFDQQISPFMRSGTVGDWKNYYNPEQRDIIMMQYVDKLKNTGFDLKFE